MNVKLRTFLKVVVVFLVLTGIWTLYRLWSVNLIIYEGELNWTMFFLTQIIFQTLLALFPILFIVHYIEKRKISSIGLSREKFVRNALFGIFLSFFESIMFVCFAYVLFIPLGGGPIIFRPNPENLGLASIFLMPLTFFLIVGPSEEIETRGYFQTRLLEHFGPRFSIIFSSFLFGVAHIPIDILIWRYDVWMMLFHLLSVFVSGAIMGYLYYRSGVLTGSIFLHGSGDTLSLSYEFSPNYERLSQEAYFGGIGLIWAVVTVFTFLLIRFLTSKLGLKAKNVPWETPKPETKEDL